MRACWQAAHRAATPAFRAAFPSELREMLLPLVSALPQLSVLRLLRGRLLFPSGLLMLLMLLMLRV